MPAPATIPGIFRTGTHAARPAATAVSNGTLYACSTHFIIYQSDGATWSTWLSLPVGQTTDLLFIIDGGGVAITTGIKGDMEMAFAGSIVQATVLADQTGSIVIDLWKDTYANFPPVDADSITAAAPPTISAALKSQDATLTGWTTSFAAGDIIRVNVDSVTSIQRATLALKVLRS